MENVAIFGAAGAIGRAVGAELDRRGVRFRVVGRSREKLDQAFGKSAHAEIFPADLSEARSAAEAAPGGGTLIYCACLPYPSHRLHPVLMRTTLEAAKLEKVARLVLPSSVYSYGVPRASSVAETHPREPQTRKGKYRKEQEDVVMEAHAARAIQGLIVRLPDFYGPHAELS